MCRSNIVLEDLLTLAKRQRNLHELETHSQVVDLHLGAGDGFFQKVCCGIFIDL